METTRTTGLREIQATRKDYDAYVECIYRTDYSDEVNQVSDEDTDYFRLDSIPTFERYCKIINKKMNSNKDFQTHIVVYENKKGKIVAVAELEVVGKQLNIKDFIVDRRFQLGGYGRKFYKQIEKQAKRRGIREIRLNCYFRGSIIFWTKMGFINRGVFIKYL